MCRRGRNVTGKVIELEQIIFAVGIHGVERIDETGYPESLADHYVADIQIAVDKAASEMDWEKISENLSLARLMVETIS